MTAVLTFEPLPDNQQHFERTDISLNVQNQVYLVGFKEHPLVVAAGSGSPSSLVSNSDDESDVTRDGLRGAHEHVHKHEVKVGPAKKVSLVRDVGFSEELVDKKLCIVPVPNKPDKLKDLVKNMGTMYAAIWLAPGYKVMLLPAHNSKVYYQRAIPGNPQWRKIKEGYGVDLADPLMTVLDDAIHIKIDVNPATKRPASEKLLDNVTRFVYRHEPRAQPYRPGSVSSYTIAPSSFNHRPIDGVHTEIDGTKRHDARRTAFQVATRVSVSWQHLDPILNEHLRIEPEKGRFSDLRAQREKVWKELDMQIENLDRMETETNPFAPDHKAKRTSSEEEENWHEASLSQPTSGSGLSIAKSKIDPIPEEEDEGVTLGRDNRRETSPNRPSRGRSKSLSQSQDREPSRKHGRWKTSSPSPSRRSKKSS